MANLIQQANDLEYVPKDQLIQMSQNPDNNYPSYLVLAEIQRRTQNEKAYAAQQPQPETTVSEELVQEFAGQQGLQGAMAQSPGPQNAFPPSDMSNMAPPSPQMGMPSQQMMSGGLTEYAEGGITGYQTGGGLGLGSDSLSQTFINPMQTNNDDIPEDVLEEVESIASSKGADFLEFAGVLKEDGSIDPLGATLAVASLHPIGRAAGWAGKAGYNLGKKYLPGIASGLKGIAKKGYDKLLTKPGLVPAKVVRQNNSQPLGQAAKDLGLGRGTTNTTVTGNIFSPGKAMGLGTSIALPAGIIKNISDSAQENYTPEVNNEDTTKSTEQLEIERLNKLLSERNTSSNNSKENNGDMLIGLGGAILRSNTIGELGGNIADMSTARQARKDSQKLAGIQGRYYEAQTDKLIAGIAGMPLKELQATAKIINDGIESGSLTLEEYGPTLQSIANKVALLQGIETPLSAQEKMLAKTRA